MEWLKKLLEAATIKDGVLDIEALMTSINAEFPKNAVPKDTYNTTSEQLKTANKTITELKKNNADNETLQAAIKTHETTIDTMKTDYENKIRDMSINTAIRAKLTDTKYPELLATKIDKTKLSVAADGSVVGIDEQLTSIRGTYKDLFTPVVTGKQPNNSGGSQPPKGKRQELEAIINDPKTPFLQRVAAKNQLYNLKDESEE